MVHLFNNLIINSDLSLIPWLFSKVKYSVLSFFLYHSILSSFGCTKCYELGCIYNLCPFLFSGGKDSCYNMVQCILEGHEMVALANLRPVETGEFISFFVLKSLDISISSKVE